MANINQFYHIPIDLEAFTAANFLANIRIRYEYQRSGHHYQYNSPSKELTQIAQLLGFQGNLSLGNIAFGILSEMLIFKDLTDYLYSDPNKKLNMVGQNFKYNLTIGDYDSGFDFRKGGAEIDVKHYATRICNSLQEVEKYQLLIDRKQYNNHKADIYIQSFTTMGQNRPYITVAGYATSDMLTINTNLPNPAYACRVTNLLSYDDLKQRFF